jgi:hypothetical protein
MPQVAALEEGAPSATIREVDVEQRVVVAVEDGYLLHPADDTD